MATALVWVAFEAEPRATLLAAAALLELPSPTAPIPPALALAPNAVAKLALAVEDLPKAEALVPLA